MKTLYFLNKREILNEQMNLPIHARESRWARENNPPRLVRVYDFENIDQLMFFVSTFLNFTKKLDHHPQITIAGGEKVQIETYTHQVNEVTEQDLRIAKMADHLYKDATYVPPEPELEEEEEENVNNDERLAEGYHFDWTTDW